MHGWGYCTRYEAQRRAGRGWCCAESARASGKCDWEIPAIPAYSRPQLPQHAALRHRHVCPQPLSAARLGQGLTLLSAGPRTLCRCWTCCACNRTLCTATTWS